MRIEELACLSEDDHSSNAIKLALVGGTNKKTLLPLTQSKKQLHIVNLYLISNMPTSVLNDVP